MADEPIPVALPQDYPASPPSGPLSLFKPPTSANVNDRTFYIVVITLASVLVAVIFVLLLGLFSQRQHINDEVFKILGPAFQTIVGVFVGVLGSRMTPKQ